jgi:hypothetical protein
MAFFQRLIAELERKHDTQPLGFQQLIAELEGKRDTQLLVGNYFAFRQETEATTQQMINTPIEVLQFAPKRVRYQHQCAEDWTGRFLTDLQQWQERAGRAEMRLRFLEKSIQQIAAELVRSAPRRPSRGGLSE